MIVIPEQGYIAAIHRRHPFFVDLRVSLIRFFVSFNNLFS
jgi:hypothetical protein